MPTELVLIILGGLAGGVALLVHGVRGRRINDDPVCRDCRFNLSGVFPAVTVCPECGSGLGRRGGVRRGERRRLPTIICVGVVFVVCGLGALSLLAYAVLTGINIDARKPAALLLWELRRADLARAGVIADEIERRMVAGMAPEAEYKVVETVLAIQADRALPWAEKVGDLIDRARLNGRVSDEQMERFRRNAAVLDVRFRGRAGAGDVLPVAVRVKELRMSDRMSINVRVHLQAATLDRAAELPPAPPAAQPDEAIFWRLHEVPTSFPLTFALSGWMFRSGRGGEEQVVCVGPIPATQAAGPATAEIRLVLEAQDASMTGGSIWPEAGGGARGPVVRFQQRVMVVVGEGESLERVPPLAEAAAAMAAHLRSMTLEAYRFDEDEPPLVNLQIEAADAPFPLAHEVVVRSGERRWKLGDVAGRGESRTVPGSIVVLDSSVTSRFVANELRDFDVDRVDVLLIPRPELAMRTIDQVRMYDGEVVIEGVEVQWLGVKSRGQ